MMEGGKKGSKNGDKEKEGNCVQGGCLIRRVISVQHL